MDLHIVQLHEMSGDKWGGEEPSVKNKENIKQASMDLHMSGYKCGWGAAIFWEIGKILKQIKS